MCVKNQIKLNSEKEKKENKEEEKKENKEEEKKENKEEEENFVVVCSKRSIFKLEKKENGKQQTKQPHFECLFFFLTFQMFCFSSFRKKK